MTHLERDLTEYWSYSADAAVADNVLIQGQVSGRGLRKADTAPFTTAAGDDKKSIVRPVISSITIDPDAGITLFRLFTVLSGTNTEDTGTDAALFTWEGGGGPITAPGPFIGASGTDVQMEITGTGTCRVNISGFWSTSQREDIT